MKLMKVAAGRSFFAHVHAEAKEVVPDLRWVLTAADGSWSESPEDCDLVVLAGDAGSRDAGVPRARVRISRERRPELARAIVTSGLGLLAMNEAATGLESIFVRLSQGRANAEPPLATAFKPEVQA